MRQYHCPKCKSTSIKISRVGFHGKPGNEWDDKVLTCFTCGKRIYGRQIPVVLQAQEKLPEEEPEQEPLIQERALRERNLVIWERGRERKRRAEKAEKERLAREENIRFFKAAQAKKPVCAWKDCSNPPKPERKYCSKSCCNKNARWAYNQRKKAAAAAK